MATRTRITGALRPHAHLPADPLTRRNSPNFGGLDLPSGRASPFSGTFRFNAARAIPQAEVDRIAFFVANAALAAAVLVLFVLG